MENERLAMIQSYKGKEFILERNCYSNWLRGKVVNAEYGSIALIYLVREEMTNPNRTMHGGVIAGILDEVIGLTCYTLGMENIFPTIDLKVDYFLSSKAGDLVRAESKLIRKGNTVINIQASLFNADDKVLAFASSNLVMSKIKHS
jgi:acyl-coenzyme A thioesterase 13